MQAFFAPRLTANLRQLAPPPHMSAAVLLPASLLLQMWTPLQPAALRAAAELPLGGAAAVPRAPAAGRCSRQAHAAHRRLGCVGECAAWGCQRGRSAAAWTAECLPRGPKPLQGHQSTQQQMVNDWWLSAGRPQFISCGTWQSFLSHGVCAIIASAGHLIARWRLRAAAAAGARRRPFHAAPPAKSGGGARQVGEGTRKHAMCCPPWLRSGIQHNAAQIQPLPTRHHTRLHAVLPSDPPTRVRASSTLTANAANSTTSLTTTTAATREQ